MGSSARPPAGWRSRIGGPAREVASDLKDSCGQVEGVVTVLPVKGKSAGDGDVIGGLRCVACGRLYAPDGTRAGELCDMCFLHVCYRERFPRLDAVRRERAR